MTFNIFVAVFVLLNRLNCLILPIFHKYFTVYYSITHFYTLKLFLYLVWYKCFCKGAFAAPNICHAVYDSLL